MKLRAGYHSSDANLIGHHLASTWLKPFIMAVIARHAESIHAWRGSTGRGANAMEADWPVDPRHAWMNPDTPVDPRHAWMNPDTPVDPRHAWMNPDTPVDPRHAWMNPDTPVDPRHAWMNPDTPVDPRHAWMWRAAGGQIFR
ncbi:hypothetical protein [Stenotrophomonas sp. NRRL B-14846]|uniref:hypothetical protein n=1 Tax=Stenotrophomonas sp. NRRL B-14846 TaxID=3162882 RepID=UPI003D2E5A85